MRLSFSRKLQSRRSRLDFTEFAQPTPQMSSNPKESIIDLGLFTEHPGPASPKHGYCRFFRRGSAAEPALTAPSPPETWPPIHWYIKMGYFESYRTKLHIYQDGKSSPPMSTGSPVAPLLEKCDFWKSESWCQQHNPQYAWWKANHLPTSALLFWRCGLTVLPIGT